MCRTEGDGERGKGNEKTKASSRAYKQAGALFAKRVRNKQTALPPVLYIIKPTCRGRLKADAEDTY
ncbi:hypothetical protein BV25DRAFT_1832774 [Artomyces pyxidatus]|uniref:Uncharacterized protein n=1 Tax=Artomyces pyxidatus TaxID=48021 RepID=A0ACB8SJ75_9AGAM|nr:hypothetical protein BV25DRAFT_1832774 [Artomyces pyxidatus]